MKARGKRRKEKTTNLILEKLKVIWGIPATVIKAIK